MSPFPYLSILLCLSFATHLSAQALKTVILQDTSLAPELSGQLMETNTGSYVLIGSSSFGVDSSYLHLIDMDEDFNANSSNSFALSGLSIFNDAEPTTDGYLLSGSNYSQVISWPFLIKTNQNLAIEWSVIFDNLDISQTHLSKTFSDGTDFTAYSYSSPGNNIVHRITGDLSANNMVSTSIENPDNRFRFYDGIRAGHPGTHILIGTIEDENTHEKDAFITSWSTNGLRWNKKIDFGVSGFEEFRQATEPVNGEFLATATNYNTDSSRSETFLLSMDTSGQVVWVKKITLSTGNASFERITQTSSGDIFLYGLANNLEASLIKLNANAELIWTKKWIWPNEYWSGVQGFYVNPQGEMMMQLGNKGDIYFAELDSSGTSCNFESGPDIEISTFTDYTEGSLSFTGNTLTPSTASITPSPRELKLETTEYCSNMATGLEKIEARTENLNLYPQPSSDFLQIETQLRTEGAKLQILNLMGQIQTEMDFSPRVSIQNLPPGWYLIRLISKGQVVSKAFIKQ